MNLKSALVALAATLTLSACGGTVDFNIESDLVANATDSFSATDTYDLAAEAGSAWKQRSKIDSITVVFGEVEVTSVGPSNTAAAVSGEIWLLPEGATDPSAAGSVLVGEWTDAEVVVGNVLSLTPTAELNAFVKSAFKGSGKFSVYGAGTTAAGARVDCTLHLNLGAKLKWKLI